MPSNSESPLPQLPPRKPDSHKGDYGRILLIGGSRGMAGAIALSGKSALRSGAGLVTLAVPTTILETVAAHDPCYMTWPLPADDLGRIAADADYAIDIPLRNANVVALGPGLGQSDMLRHLVRKWYAEISVPMVVDADALNLLSEVDGGFKSHGGPRVLTPHPGEFRTMAGIEKTASREALEAKALECAGQWGVTIILKGHRSLITDGVGSFHNTTGNPGMATGGAGDVLTGVTAAMLSQFASPLEAARLAAHVHGFAGDLAAQELGQAGMTALDVCNALPRAFLKFDQRD
jgi:ADP-dependent NAD(P)H-hydrate dehydratase